ncbi:hypothetical protein R1sor_022156 [Riccia sorocarpa]|uniref:Trimethylguanosine synthase n=1 Tax=Riccia sorocarpa TaxID=122646 RepID=A0ABD3GJ09_9MARC
MSLSSPPPGNLIEEMAALGLPTCFMSRSEFQLKNTKKCSDSKTEPPKAAETLEATNIEAQTLDDPLFSVRTVKLYTQHSSAPMEILNHLQGSEDECPADETGLYADNQDAYHVGVSGSDSFQNGQDSEAGQKNVQAEAGEEVAITEAIWEPVWDEQYQRYYFCNTQSWESTWEPPPGYERYGLELADQSDNSALVRNDLGSQSEINQAESDSTNVNQCTGIPSRRDEMVQGSECTSAVAENADTSSASSPCHDGQDVNEGDECQKVRTTTASTFDLPERSTSFDVVMEGEDELVEVEQEKSTVCGNVMKTDEKSGVLEGSIFIAEDSAPAMIEDQFENSLPSFPRACGVHMRFADSDDSSPETSDNDTEINWEEIGEDQSEAPDDRQYEREAYSPSQEYGAFTDAEETLRLSTDRAKRRRMKKTLSIIESEKLEKVLLPGMPETMNQSLVKYWLQRYSLFSRFDEGVRLDEEGWFSVTPEVIAEHQASRCPTGLVVDAFAGVGGNAIQFALKKNCVIAIDINPARVELARHNAEIYGVSDRIEFIVGDFFLLAPSLKADLIFLSPPWGGPQYLNEEKYDIQTMLQPKDGLTLVKTALTIAPNVVLFLPRNVRLLQLKELAWLTSPPLPCEVEKNYVDNRLKGITAYYGDVAVRTSD